MHVPFVKTTLANGLDVIVHQDRRAPLAAVNVWYHVGSKNERPGLTGLAHLFEHLMFEGSEHQPGGYFPPLQEAGASLNGSTSTDRTNYWELVPSNALTLALWMEADRMGWLLPALSQERFETQRAVVLNERRQSYENRPYGLAQFVVMETMFPPEHPYHWPTIGRPADLEAATLDDVKAFFARYYHPGNASLTIAGDVDVDAGIALADRLFGAIPRGDHVPPPITPALEPLAARRLWMPDRVDVPRLYVSWRSPGLFARGDAELDLIGDVLGNARTSRLYRRLVHDRRIAVELAAGQMSRELIGTFQIVASAAPGHSLDELEAAILEEVDRFAADGPTDDELDRGRAQAEAAFVFRLQSLGGFGGKADQLNAYNVYCDSPDGFAQDLARYVDASADDLRSAAAWLRPDRAITLSVVPAGRPDLAASGSEPVAEGAGR
ncbi:MAG: insulinase family protein [Acidobacteria bacterium]|nr:insulinase family protein [Acidobacteriota bacterium]